MLRVGELRNAVAQVEHMSGIRAVGIAWGAKAVQCANDLLGNLFRVEQNNTLGSRLPRKATRSPTMARACPRFMVQSRPTTSQPVSAIWSSHKPPPW